MNIKPIRTFACLAAFLLLSSYSFGSTNTCLWKVSSTNKTLYLQGSIHLLQAKHYPLPAVIEEAYSKSDVLVLEVNMQEMLSMEAQQLMLSRALFSEGHSLQTQLKPNVYERLSLRMKKQGQDISNFEQFKPWFVVMHLTILNLNALGFETKYGIDHYFFQKALEDGKSIVGLETSEFQLSLLESLSSKTPNEFVERALADLDVIEEDFETILTAWLKGNIEELGTLIKKSFNAYPNLYQTFVTDRNERWLGELERMLESPRNHIVVVGAAHLPGEKGLLELLRTKGYKLEQL